MEIKRVLLFLKQNGYEKIITEGKRLPSQYKNYIEQIEKAKYEHLQTLKEVKLFLKKLGIEYELKPRNECFDEKKYDIIITIGGDGTFIRASHYTFTTPILGINSSPSASVGYFCIANKENIKEILESIKENKWNIRYFNRIKVMKSKKELPIYALNDVLFSPINPASTSKYIIKINKYEEIQKSSGVWITTYIGQTAGYKSAKGKKFSSKNTIAFIIREPYMIKNITHITHTSNKHSCCF
jgi:NAD+ kinase